jgi:hypothetical protein
MERMAMKRQKDNCAGMESKLADLLLDPAAASARVRMHVAGCDRCRQELDELRAAMALLDRWEGPEPSPYFLGKLAARLREEQAAAPANWPASWMARLRARFAYGPAMPVRPLAAMALTIVLLLGGGTYLGITDWDRTDVGQPAVVHDLQTLDSNAQLLDQMEALSSANEDGN